MSTRILSDENYMNDALSSIYSNLILGLKRKEERSIWGPAEVPSSKSSCVSHRSYFTKIVESELVNKNVTFDVNNQGKNTIHSDLTKGESFNQVNSCKKKVYNVNSTKEVKSELNNLSEIKKTDKIFRSRSNSNQSDDAILRNTEIKKDNLSRKPVSNKNEYEEVLSKFKEENIHENVKNDNYLEKRKESNLEQKKPSKSILFVTEDNDRNRNNCQVWPRDEKKCFKFQNQSVVQPPKSLNKCEKRRDRSKKQFASTESLTKNKIFNDSNGTISRIKKENMYESSNTSNQCITANEIPHLCTIQITNRNGDKNFRITVDCVTVSRIRRTLPKLSADIPEIDSECKEINFSADAMNVILRYVFCSSFLKSALQSAAIGVEVLAAARSWNIKGFSKLFQKEFLQHVFKSNDVSLVFAHAVRYNLEDICEACKNISLDKTVLNTNPPKKRQKTCLVSVFTHVEPLEISIPFEPIQKDIISKDLQLNFMYPIKNIFKFKAVSGCFSIVGFRVQLNEEYVSVKSDRKVSIDYSVIKGSNYQVIENETEEKPFRAVNAVYFKKQLILNPKEVGEIVIEIENIESYLCSAFMENKISVKKSLGELDLVMESTRKIGNSERKLFFVGNFLYHVKKGT